ncbi:MAG TPA: hypothetical protein VLX92_25985, partial [Kofleriaceae bacterium]|nr:hypothetical protein [Kofleriaceae bacterium]
AAPGDPAETLASLANLYEREKRYLALAEILHRQVAAIAKVKDRHKEVIALYEKLGQVYADRLSAPQQAAQAWQEVLELEPGHAKALRTLRELYAMSGDFAGLEALYARLGQQEELVEALLAIADRLDAKAARLPLVERAAQLAQARAEAAPQQPALLEKARQVWERVLAVEPQHVGAAAALAPIYAKQEKWTRLLAVLEIELAALHEPALRLVKLAQIRQLCEQRLASKNLAFGWALRAFDIDPSSEQLYTDVMRLASEPDHWREVIASFERALPKADDALRGKLLRELARIAGKRLGDLEAARGYYRQVLQLAPGDRDAEASLEDLASQLADWPELLASYRRRAAREGDASARAKLLIEIAALQEQKLVDLDGAAATYREALAAAKGHAGALRALARIEEARGDWESLVDVLGQELAAVPDGQARFDLLMRLGALEEHNLERFGNALRYYRDALAIPAPGAGVRQAAVDAIARIVLSPSASRAIDGGGLSPAGSAAEGRRGGIDGGGLSPAGSAAEGRRGMIDAKQRVAAVRQILPQLERTRQLAAHAAALEILRAAEDTPAGERVDLDRQLMRLYHIELGDPAAAWQAGLRVVAADPGDADVRAALAALAGQLGRDGEWARHLAAALGTLRAGGGAPAQVRALATELAVVTGQRLADRAAAERAWLVVLDVEPDASDAFDALVASYRDERRFTDLRALLERRAEVTLDEKERLDTLLAIATLEEDVLGDPARATIAYRRVLELDSGNAGAFDALDKLYSESRQWRELEELLARRSDHVPTGDPRLQELAFRRATLFAHELGEPIRAIDLLEDVLARQRRHEDARELLEEMLTDPRASAVTMRVARLLEPLYEHDKLWKDLVAVLRVERSLVEGTEAVELVARIATLQESELGATRDAFDAWLEVLRLDPAHERARVELARLAQWLNRWPEATTALEAAVGALPAGDVQNRVALLAELASYYDTQLGDAPRAIAAYRRLIEIDPSSPSTVRRAAAALARLHEDAKDWAALRAVMRKQAEHADDAAERRALLARVAALEEEQLGERDAAIATWAEILDDQPADAGALHALERLYQAGEKWRPLIDILHRRVEHAGDDKEAIALLARIAEIHEHRLHQPEDAIAAWLEVLDRDPEAGRALAELARLYRAAGRHVDLLEVLERQAQLADHPEQIGLAVAIAQLLSGPLARPVEALERWANVLRDEPQHPAAIAAVEAALEDPDLRAHAADILRPVYGATAQEDKLAQLSLLQAEWTEDTASKLRALGEVVRLREHRLGDKAGAFAAQLLALRHAATEPELAHMVAETERLAGELGREADLIDVYREVAPSVLDAEIQRRLYLDIADLSRAVRRDLALARDYYQKVLDLVPEDRRALAALEAIYRDASDDEHLVEILLRQASAEAQSGDVDDRVAALVESAGLYASLRRPDDAIVTWEQVLELAPERGDAIYSLESLYSQQGRWHDVVELYERRLGFVTSIDEAVALRVELGAVHEKQLRDVEAAIDNYAAALGGNAKHAAAITALERLLGDPDARVSAA